MLLASPIDLTNRRLAELITDTIYIYIMSVNNMHDELGTFFEVSRDPICICTFNGDLIRSNYSFKSLFGYDKFPQHFFDIAHLEDKPSMEQQLESLASSNAPVNFTLRCVTVTGVYLWIEWNALAKGIYVYAIGKDITTHKKRECELQFITDRLALATRSADIGVWELNTKTNHVVWDDKMYELYGKNRSTFT